MKNVYNWKKFNEVYYPRIGRKELILGPCPVNEIPVNLKDDNYIVKAREECNKYIDMLQERFPTCANVIYKIKEEMHESGKYLDVVIEYRDCNEAEAIFVQDNLPNKWSDTEELNYAPDEDEEEKPYYHPNQTKLF